MKNIIPAIIACVLFQNVYSSELKGDTFTFIVPHDIEANVQSDPELYSLQWAEPYPGQPTLFMMYQLPSLNNSNSIPELVDDTKTGLKQQFKQQGLEVLEVTDTRLKYGIFQGLEVKLKVQKSVNISESKKPDIATVSYDQYIGFMWDGSNVWNYQLTAGSTNDIHKMRTILRSGKINR